MEIGQSTLKHSSGSEISNWTTFPGKWLSSVLAGIPLLLVQKKRITFIWGNQKEVDTYDLHSLSKNSPDHSFHFY